MHQRVLYRSVAALALVALVAGCGGSAATATPATPATAAPASAANASAAPASIAAADIQICHMIFDTSIPFYTNLIKGSNDEAKKLGVKVDIVNGTAELTGQIAVIQQFITRPCSAILVSTSDSNGIVPVVKQANAAGIPVFAVNLLIGEGADVVTYVGVDDYQFGLNQATLLKQALPNGGKVAYMNGKLGVSAQIQRKQGFTDGLKNATGFTIIDEQSANWDSGQALALTQDWLSKYPKGQLDAIVDQGPEGAVAAKYVMDNGRSEIKFIVGDYPAEVKAGITNGSIYGTTDQDPYPQGTQSVLAAYNWLTGAKDQVKQPKMLLDLPIITKANVDQFPPAWGG